MHECNAMQILETKEKKKAKKKKKKATKDFEMKCKDHKKHR